MTEALAKTIGNVDVDKSVVLGEAVIDSPVLGKISPLGLSGGVKTLILIKNEPQNIFNASTCGDNCAKWILKIAEKQDTTINLRHLMDFGDEKFDICIVNTTDLSTSRIISLAKKSVIQLSSYTFLKYTAVLKIASGILP